MLLSMYYKMMFAVLDVLSGFYHCVLSLFAAFSRRCSMHIDNIIGFIAYRAVSDFIFYMHTYTIDALRCRTAPNKHCAALQRIATHAV